MLPGHLPTGGGTAFSGTERAAKGCLSVWLASTLPDLSLFISPGTPDPFHHQQRHFPKVPEDSSMFLFQQNKTRSFFLCPASPGLPRLASQPCLPPLPPPSFCCRNSGLFPVKHAKYTPAPLSLPKNFYECFLTSYRSFLR